MLEFSGSSCSQRCVYTPTLACAAALLIPGGNFPKVSSPPLCFVCCAFSVTGLCLVFISALRSPECVCMCVSALGLLVSSCRLPTAVFLAFPGGSDRKNPPAMQETWVWFLAWADSLEESMATHSSVLAWRIPQTEESGRLQSLGSQKVRHDWATKHST